jgi:tetratricopeptide (TPR) repeat protein
VVNFPPEWVAAFTRNQWQVIPEWVAGLDQNLQLFLKDYKHAIKSADKGVEIAPENARIFYVRGWVYCEIGNYDKAIKDLSRAIELNPLDDFAYFYRGHAYYYGISKKDERAMNDLKTAARLGNKTAQEQLTEWRIQW